MSENRPKSLENINGSEKDARKNFWKGFNIGTGG